MEKVSEAEAGCWIEGSWGHYCQARLIFIAVGLGWVDAEAERLAEEYFEYEGSSADVEAIYDAADDAEDWMNDNIAPEGLSFGWFDGEFFLWSWANWDNEE